MSPLLIFTLLLPLQVANPDADSPITHGTEIGPQNIGLRGAGVRPDDLTPVKGGKASALASSTAPNGRPMLRRLDIDGQLTVDVPCILSECRLKIAGGLYGVRNTAASEWEASDCDFEAAADSEGKAASCVLLAPRTLRRCRVMGGPLQWAASAGSA